MGEMLIPIDLDTFPDAVKHMRTPQEGYSSFEKSLRSIYHTLPPKLKNPIRQIRRTVVSGKYLGKVVEVECAGVKAKFEVKHPTASYHTAELAHEAPYLAEFINSIRPSDIVLDVGSSQGPFSILAGVAHPDVCVYSLEPHDETRLELEKNIALNGLEGRVIPMRYALSNKSSSGKLFNSGAKGEAPSLVNSKKFTDAQDIQLITVDELIESGILKAPEVIKFDIEGAEGDGIVGMLKLLKSQRRPRDIFMEVHTTLVDDFNTDPSTIFDLTRFGYKFVSSYIRYGEILCHAKDNRFINSNGASG